MITILLSICCMYKHRKKEKKTENILDSDNVNDKILNIIDAGENEEDVDKETTEINVNDCMNGTFLNPSQSDNTPQETMLNCEKCHF